MNQASANSFIQQACLLNTQIGCVRTILRVKASRGGARPGRRKRVARPLASTWNSSTSSGNPRNWNGPWLRHRTPAGVEPRQGRAGVAGGEDLPAVGGAANPRGGVHGHPDVVRCSTLGVAAVNADANTNVHLVRPRGLTQRALHGDGCVNGRRGMLERGEQLVGPGLDDVSRAFGGGPLDDGPHAVQQLTVAITKLMEQSRRSLDVGEQQRHEAGRQVLRRGLASELALGLQLSGDEPHGDDSESLGSLEQPGPRLLPGRLVFEHDLVEASQGVAHVAGVVDRQPAPATPVDIGEGAVRQPGSIGRLEPCHVTRS